MTPNVEKIEITDNLAKIKEFIDEIIVQPRKTLKKWSEVTNQTPAAKLDISDNI